jgi:hypothetical protein
MLSSKYPNAQERKTAHYVNTYGVDPFAVFPPPDRKQPRSTQGFTMTHYHYPDNPYPNPNIPGQSLAGMYQAQSVRSNPLILNTPYIRFKDHEPIRKFFKDFHIKTKHTKPDYPGAAVSRRTIDALARGNNKELPNDVINHINEFVHGRALRDVTKPKDWQGKGAAKRKYVKRK